MDGCMLGGSFVCIVHIGVEHIDVGTMEHLAFDKFYNG
jgi:hypothetical protein